MDGQLYFICPLLFQFWSQSSGFRSERISQRNKFVFLVEKKISSKAELLANQSVNELIEPEEYRMLLE